MDVFSLRDTVVRRVQAVRDVVHDDLREDLRTQIDAIYADERYWPEPLIQINPSFQQVTTIEKLVDDGLARPGLRRDLPGQPVGREPARRDALPLHAPGAGHRARRATARATSSRPARVRQVALPSSSPSSTRSCAPRRGAAGTADARHRHLPDERARQQPAGGTRRST